MRDRVLGATLLASALAACGGGMPKTRPGEITGEVTYKEALAQLDGARPPAGGGGEPKASRPIQATALAADLRAAGLDLAKLPTLDKMDVGTKKKLMPLFSKSLGVPCTGCHASADDYKTETRDLKVAREMWNNFVVPLRAPKKEPLFCDSCHGGASHVLARKDKEALNKFMDDEYVAKLERADGEEQGCGTCHGDYLEFQIIEKLWKIR